jgi:hypothetical protein
MKYSDFRKHVETSCLYEAIYDDSESRRILVIRLMDAYLMVQKAVQREREECAKVCEAEGQRIDASWQSCAAAIRERDETT